MVSTYVVCGALSGLAGLVVIIRQQQRERSRLAPLPPGPKPDFLIGNVRDFPQTQMFETFTQWREKYGDLIYLNLLGTSMVIVNSFECANEIGNKRAEFYSHRAQSVMLMDVMGWYWSVAFKDLGKEVHSQRRVFRSAIGPAKMGDYDEYIEKEITNVLEKLDNFTGDPYKLLHQSVGGILIQTAYGPEIWREFGEDLVKINHDAVDLTVKIMGGFNIVEFMPFLQYLPTWFPGAHFKRIGEYSLGMTMKVRYWLWGEAEKAKHEGRLGNCVAEKYIGSEDKEEENDARDAIATMYLAGADTTGSATQLFLAAMLKHPEVQKKVQAEIDEIVGGDRLPTPEDIARLPYFQAAWRESIRWQPSALGIPHRAVKDDVWNGMFIPKDSIIQFNVLAMLSDPRVWEEPELYKPERFLDADQSKLNILESMVFGWGKRICVGRHFALRVAPAILVSILALYDIVPVEGETVPEKFTYADAVTRRSTNFRCTFRRRERVS